MQVKHGGTGWRIGRHRARRSAEMAYAAFTLFIMTRPLQRLFQIGGVDFQLIAIFLLFIIPGWVVLKRLPAVWRMLRQDPLLLFLIVLVPLSALWSLSPTRTLAGSVNLLAGTFMGIYLATRFSVREQVWIVALALATAAVLSLVVSVAFPTLGKGVARGTVEVWSGVYLHKNGLGRYMAIGAAALWTLRYERRLRPVLLVLFGLALVLILLANSATSLLTLLLAVGLLPIYRLLRARVGVTRWVAVAALALVVITTGVVLLHPAFSRLTDYVLIQLGRRPDQNSLLVRLALWDYVWQFIGQRPWLGHGFDAFWQNGRTVHIATTNRDWLVFQAHNGYLELWLQLGLVGLVAMVLHLIGNFRRALRLGRNVPRVESLWTFTYLTILAVFNFTYSALLGQLTVPWTLYVAVTLSMWRQLVVLRAPQPAMTDETGAVTVAQA